METQPIDQSFSSEEMYIERPQFLSVLCILTWIACGLIFISTLWSVMFQPTPEEQYEQVEKMREISPQAAEQMEAAFESQTNSNQVLNTVLNLASIILSAFGAYQMWNLKRSGFFIYTAGEFLPYISFAFGGTKALAAAGSMSGIGDAMVGMAITFMLLLDIAFIVMYGVNLKYMRR